MGFVPINTRYVRTELEVRSFTHSLDNRGYSKIWAVPGYAHAPFFSQNCEWAFVQMDSVNVPARFEVCSFTHSWDNRGY